ncbi:MAG: FAD-binding domain-containing protein, partial [Cyanobacteria bacterium P01_F01_bin.42]
SYEKAGGTLVILQADPVRGIATLAETLGAEAVYWNSDVEPYSTERDRAVVEALKEKGIESHQHWDQVLHAPGTILTGSDKPYRVYSPFWRNWQKQTKASPYAAPETLEKLTSQEHTLAKQAGAIALLKTQDLDVTWDNPLNIPVGEAAALEALDQFCDNRPITEYDEARNFPIQAGTSQLSAALKFGTVGIRTVWSRANQVYDRCRSDEERKGVQVWQQELAWREFYQHVMYIFPELSEGPYREQFKAFPWSDNQDHFQAWCEGRTGYPIVDAAMRQLNETGWMHNRCRMIVASFLTKDLILNWQWGEKYFMQRLVDGDLSANNGGWQWSASSGMDPKPLRIFNPASQAQKFDAAGDYIRRWLPELSSVSTKKLVTGSISTAECDRADYPAPIVDHSVQQRTFKALYKEAKEAVG